MEEETENVTVAGNEMYLARKEVREKVWSERGVR